MSEPKFSKSVITRAKNRLQTYKGNVPHGAIGLLKDGVFLYEIDLLPKITQPLLRKLSDFNFDPTLYIPMKAGNAMDGLFSKVGGLMPATNYLIIGDPGIGKTTSIVHYASEIKTSGAKIAFVSAEMAPTDLAVYAERFPKFNDIDTLFFSEEFARDDEYDVRYALEVLFDGGYDLIIIDSLAEVNSAIKDHKKWSSVLCEKKFVDLMVKANTKHRTSFLVIQQVTKGGEFVGSNKLKHNTTGMIEIRYENNQSHFKVTKNRRGFKYDKLYFTLLDDIIFDEQRLKNDENFESISKSAKMIIDAESKDLLKKIDDEINILYDVESEVETETLIN
jgi:KaiC/GvpD/RAD55 family RecA-like ATPase